jgi:hypothetical protein
MCRALSPGLSRFEIVFVFEEPTREADFIIYELMLADKLLVNHL